MHTLGLALGDTVLMCLVNMCCGNDRDEQHSVQCCSRYLIFEEYLTFRNTKEDNPQTQNYTKGQKNK